MNKLTIVNRNEKLLVDSREVAKMIGKEHKDLLVEIEGRKDGKNVGILQVLEKGNFPLSDYFIENTYKIENNNKNYKCYLISKMGCELIGNKQQGEKGILFTATYVTKFNEMEEQLKKNIRKLNRKQVLVLDIYEGGSKAIIAHKELSKIEIEEVTKKLKDGNNKIITGFTVVEMLGVKGLTTTLLNKWFCENGFGKFTKLPHEKNRFFTPSLKFEKYVAYEGYSLTGLTAKKNKTKVLYSTGMVDRLLERHMKSIVEFVKSEKGEQIIC